ncbi:uncharacterized protein VTP21DRAFT_10225 [Calcarisporiella thermophila]|uniref:uncharacterized protein n=1 Tax=Calcarisporiella thermophila TaxID=911321 RepID=UPI003742D776
MPSFGWYRIANANEFLVVTGAGIKDIKLQRKGLIWPWQHSQSVSLVPLNYTLDLNVMSIEKLEFLLPGSFTVGPKDDLESVERYARLLTNTPKGESHVQELVRGVIEGEARVLAASMTIEEIFRDRRSFKENIVRSIQSELDQFGLFIYNANIKQLMDTSGSEYFKYLRQKTHEGAISQARVDVSEARKRGEIGEKQRIAQTRQETSKIEADTVAIENENKQAVAKSSALLKIKEAEYSRQEEIARIEAEQAAALRKAELLRHVQETHAAAETERLRAELVARAKAEAEAQMEAANAELYQQQKKAEGQMALFQTKIQYLREIIDAFHGDHQAALQYFMMESGTFERLANANATAVQNLNPKITVWNTDGSGASGSNPVADVMKNLPPLLATIQDQTGILPPKWMADMSQTQLSKGTGKSNANPSD